MYSALVRYQQAILAGISQSEVSEYDWLVQNIQQSFAPQYQRRYRNFWEMNVARLGNDFYRVYFGALKKTGEQTLSLSNLCQTLYQSSARSNGRRTLQFSFATKLLHMLDTSLPVYDSRVARFYLFQPPTPTELPLLERITGLIAFHNFLVSEYARVIGSGYLAPAIAAFRHQFNPRLHTDERILDWLIWAFVGLADNGALLSRQIAYV